MYVCMYVCMYYIMYVRYVRVEFLYIVKLRIFKLMQFYIVCGIISILCVSRHFANSDCYY